MGYSILGLPCCCKAQDDGGGGGGSPVPICQELCDCIDSDRYEGLEITSASYYGTQFSLSGFNLPQRPNNNYELALVSVTQISSSVNKCVLCGNRCSLAVAFKLDVQLDVSASNCVGNTCALFHNVVLGSMPRTGSTGDDYPMNVSVGCQCCYNSGLQFSGPSAGLISYPDYLVCSNGGDAGFGDLYVYFIVDTSSSDYPSNMNSGCGNFSEPYVIRLVAKHQNSVPFSGCSADLISDPADDPFTIEITLSPKTAS